MDFVRNNEIKRLEVFEMRVWRRMLKISWTEYKTNDELLELAEEQKTPMTTLRQRQREMVGTRVTSRLKKVTARGAKGANERRKIPGRPRKCY